MIIERLALLRKKRGLTALLPDPYDPIFTSTFAWFMRVFMSGT